MALGSLLDATSRMLNIVYVIIYWNAYSIPNIFFDDLICFQTCIVKLHLLET